MKIKSKNKSLLKLNSNKVNATRVIVIISLCVSVFHFFQIVEKK